MTERGRPNTRNTSCYVVVSLRGPVEMHIVAVQLGRLFLSAPASATTQSVSIRGVWTRRFILLSAKLMSQNLPFPADGGKTSERIERTEVQPPSGFFNFGWGKETLFKRGSRKKTGPRWRCATRAGTRLTAARSCYAGKRSLALVAAAWRRALLRRGRPRPRGA